jgi:hypothetical protein
MSNELLNKMIYAELLDEQALATADERRMRAYRTSSLPVMKSSVHPEMRRQVTEKLYTEVCSAWRFK